jgi:hypothetical protein
VKGVVARLAFVSFRSVVLFRVRRRCVVGETSDRRLWAELVAVDREVRGRRWEFLRRAQDPTEVLLANLEVGAEVHAALRLLADIPDAVTPDMLPLLVDRSRDVRYGVDVRRVIGTVAWGERRDWVLSALREIIPSRLENTDDDEMDYSMYVRLLLDAQAWDVLRLLIERALASDDPGMREAAMEDLTEYGPMWGASPEAP